jgi:heme-degrading monooxygenase HmoA
MAVKVLIERQVKNGKGTEFLNVLRELRTAALYRHGYISGETLQSDDDLSRYVVVSNWQSLEDWEKWRDDSGRDEISKKLEQLIISPEKYSVFHFVYLDP